MATFMYQRLAPLAAAGLVTLGACADIGSNPTASAPSGGSRLAPSAGRFFLGQVTNSSVVLGELKVCKQGNVHGEYLVARTQYVRAGVQPPSSPSGSVLNPATVQAGQCVVVAVDNGPDGIASSVTVDETSPGFVSVSAVDERGPLVGYEEGDPILINQFHGTVITYVNHVEPPHEQVCDFITFGRLVLEVNGQKVVISGNAGGNKPGGGILGEFHIEANGVDNHVSDIDSYDAIESGALSGLTNSRIVTGTAKNGTAVELRLYDGGEPGKGTDRVYVKLGNNEIFGASGKLIDMGNMQYHSTCRGPK